MQKRGQSVPPDFQESQPDDGNLDPPEPRRVARRATCLGAVALRGLATTWAPNEEAEFLPDLHSWLASSNLDDELEPAERDVILTPPGQLVEGAAVNACWRWEGAAVLAASLGWISLPAYDEVVDTTACGRSAGLMAPPDRLAALWESAAFSDRFDREAYANQILAIHWRLRQFVHNEPKPIDFAQFARGVSWADLDLRSCRLLGGDLAIGDQPISRAARDRVGMAMSIASERHIAANWLIGWEPIYGEVENPT